MQPEEPPPPSSGEWGGPYPSDPQVPSGRSRIGAIWVILMIVAGVAVGLGGVGVAAFLIFRPAPVAVPSAVRSPAAPSATSGRYRSAPVACAKLDLPPYTFSTEFQSPLQDNEYLEECQAYVGGRTSGGSAEISIERDVGPDGVATARNALVSAGPAMPGTGFEDPPHVTYQADFGDCTFEYVRSNEYVSVDFKYLPGAQDAASCGQVGLTYVKQFYALVG